MSSSLHIPSLSIERFRGLRSLKLPKLGRVTLVAGANGIGKTTVLDAIRLYASRGDSRILIDLIDSREEYVSGSDDEGDTVLFPDFASLFNNYEFQASSIAPSICISSTPGARNVSLQLITADDEPDLLDIFPSESRPRDLRVSVGIHSRTLPIGPMAYYSRTRFGNVGRHLPLRHPRTTRQPDSWPPPIQLESLGPSLLNNSDLARLWDEVTLTEAEDLAVQALRLIVGDTLERLAVVGDPPALRNRNRGRRVVAKLSSSSVPIPLKRLGDGAHRLLAIAIALANCKDGILLVDEVENGIHYSIQPALWHMLFVAAEKANVQVVAVTHSWDCIVGFAQAAIETPSLGTMFRLERFGNDLHAIFYSEENLAVAAKQRTEVR